MSPANDKQSSERSVWLDDVFKLKSPDTKVHGLGVFSETLLMRYNWFSGDAASWFDMPMYGMAQIREMGQTTNIKLRSTGKKDMQTCKSLVSNVLWQCTSQGT